MNIYLSRITQKVVLEELLGEVTPLDYSDKDLFELDERSVIRLIMKFDEMVQKNELDKLLRK